MPAHRPAPPFSPDRARFDRRFETPRLWDRPPGPGSYRRRIVVRAVDETRVRGELEDDFHHFRVDIRHDGETVVHVEGTGIRGPWSTCLGAGDPLREITGVRVTTHPTALAAIDARRNCTHMFDLAGMVIHHAARGGEDRRYDIEISDPSDDDRTRATLWRDGDALLAWELVGGEIAGPDDWVGAPLRSKFIPWACERFAGDDDGAEAAIALRRAIDIARGRLMDLDEMTTAEPLLDVMEGICHSMSASNAPVAIRQRGSARDFTRRPELLLGDFDAAG